MLRMPLFSHFDRTWVHQPHALHLAQRLPLVVPQRLMLRSSSLRRLYVPCSKTYKVQHEMLWLWQLASLERTIESIYKTPLRPRCIWPSPAMQATQLVVGGFRRLAGLLMAFLTAWCNPWWTYLVVCLASVAYGQRQLLQLVLQTLSKLTFVETSLEKVSLHVYSCTCALIPCLLTRCPC